MKLNDAQVRVCRITEVLAGKEVTGLSNAQLAKAVRTSESRMVSDLRNMEHCGMVERLATGHWRLGPKLVQIAQAHAIGLDAMRHQLAEIEQRFGRKPS